jgi:outer membrane putative beta-barrel porin/alpha-amylase
MRRRTCTACAIVVTLGILAASPVWAARPLTTEDTGTLDPGKVEAELGVDYLRGGGAQVFLLPGGLALNFGLLPRLEGGVAATFVVLEPQDKPSRAGFGDTVVKLRYRFLDETSRSPALMAAVSARLPTGDQDRGLGAEDVDVQALAVASKTFSPITVTIHSGYTFVMRDRALDLVNVSASAEVQMSEAWSIVGEIVTELATSRQNADRVVVRAGAVYAIGERVRFDAAAGFGVTRASPDLLLTVGVTIALD